MSFKLLVRYKGFECMILDEVGLMYDVVQIV